MRELETLLARSSASKEFKEDIRSYFARGEADRIDVEGRVPAVKVIRLLKQILHAEPDLPIERLFLRATSGCSDFAGRVTIDVAGDRHEFEFVWDCRWRAQEEGWLDFFGLPDQIRAAREFDWRCFKLWRGMSAAA